MIQSTGSVPSWKEDPDEKQAQLTFVVGGGGLSGVETAAEV